LPADLEQAALDQLAFWFQNRDRQGLQRLWEYHGLYRQFADLDLLTSTRAVLVQVRAVGGVRGARGRVQVSVISNR
jgi:hypothetical protein